MQLRNGLSAVAVTSALALSPLSAFCQTDPAVLAATRRDIIHQAQEARTANDHARALDLAQRAGQLSMSPSLRRFIAEEQNALGDVAGALGSAEVCVQEAGRDTASPARDEHMAACRALVTALRPRVGRVVVMVPASLAGAEVQVAGHPLPQAVWGVPHLVTPGTVTVNAHAAHYRDFHQEITVRAGESVNVNVALVAAPEEPVIAPPPPPPPLPPVIVRRGPGAGPWIVAGAGTALLITSGIAFGLRGSALSARDAMCDASGCPESARPDHDRAVTFNALGNITLGVGIAAVAGGVLWYALGGTREVVQPTTTVHLQAGDGRFILGLQGSL